MESTKFCLELRKRKEKAYLEFSSDELRENPDKILNIMKKEFTHLKSWFLVIMYFYSINDYQNFKKFSDELSKIDIDNNPYYRDQKETFKYILNVFAFYFINLAQKAKEKEKYEEISTSFFNQAEKLEMFDKMTMVCKGFIYFAQGNYSQAEFYFSNISESDKSINKRIIILAKIGKGLNFFNKGSYEKAEEQFSGLIRDYDYIQENVLESLGICYYNLGKLGKAVKIFRKTLDLSPNNYKVLVYLAIIQLKDFNFDVALFDKAFELVKKAYLEKTESEFDYIFIIFADLLLVSGKIKEAEEIVGMLNKIVEFGDMKTTAREIMLSNESKYVREVEEIKSEVYCLNANIHHYKNNINEAYIWYNKAIQCNPNNLKAHFGLGQTYLMMENYKEAEKYFNPAKYSMEKDNILYSNKFLAFIYAKEKKKDYDKITDMYNNALAFNDKDIDCYIELAILNELRKPEETIKMYEKAITLIRKIDFEKYNFNSTKSLYDVKDIFPEILNNYATVKLRLNQINDVDKVLNEALAIVRKRRAAISSQLKPQAENQMPSNLEALQEEAIRFKALELSIYFNLGLYNESRNEFGEAYKLFKLILEQNPFFLEADIKLGELAKQRGNKEKAVEYMKSAIDKHFHKQKDQEPIQQNNNLNINNINNPTNPCNLKLFPFLSKPASAMLMKAHVQMERGADDEVRSILTEVYKMTEGKDPYSLIFLGNFSYELATQNRNKEEEFRKYMKEALFHYVSALELDKYNAYAAIGVANVFAEFSMESQALDVYKNIHEKLPNNVNAYANEALILMSDKKLEKASIVVNKLLKKFYNGKNPKFENILAKIYMELKDFDKAFNILRSLMLRYPDDLFYRYNYAFCLWAKSENIISKKDRRVYETQEAIRNLEKAKPIFEAVYKIKRENRIYMRSETDEKLITSSEFYYKCKLMLDCIKPTYETCKNLLEHDKIREAETMQKIEENNQKLFKMLQDQKESDEKKMEEIRRKMEENEILANSLKEQAIEIFNTKAKEKESKKAKNAEDKQTRKEDDLGLNEDEDQVNYSAEKDRENRHKKEKKHKKHKNKKRKKSDYYENVDYFDSKFNNDFEDSGNKQSKKKLKKRKREFDLENFRDDNVNNASPKDSYREEDSCSDNEEEYHRENEANNDSNRDENSYQENQDFMQKYESNVNAEKDINVDQNLVEEDVDYEDN